MKSFGVSHPQGVRAPQVGNYCSNAYKDAERGVYRVEEGVFKHGDTEDGDFGNGI